MEDSIHPYGRNPFAHIYYRIEKEFNCSNQKCRAMQTLNLLIFIIKISGD